MSSPSSSRTWRRSEGAVHRDGLTHAALHGFGGHDHRASECAGHLDGCRHASGAYSVVVGYEYQSFVHFFMLVCALIVPLPSVPFPNAALTAATVFENSARSKLLRLGRATFGDKYTDKKEMHEPPTVDSIEFLVVRFHFPFYSLSFATPQGRISTSFIGHPSGCRGRARLSTGFRNGGIVRKEPRRSSG